MALDDEALLAIAREGFMDEARSMLKQFEGALLAMEADPGDREAINTAFRAAHTIKGSAGLFGLEAIVGFTHEVEGVLDAMRDGTLGLSEHAMALLLESSDQMEALLGEDGFDGTDAAVARRSRLLGEQLAALRRPLAQDASPCAPDPAASLQPAEATSRDWNISLRMGPDALRNGLDPLSFIRYLDRIGTVTRLLTLGDGVPPLESLDPENCHLAFEIELGGVDSREQIEDVFSFLMDDCELLVAAAGDRANRGAEAATVTASPLQACAGSADITESVPVSAPATVEQAPLDEPERRLNGRDRRAGDEARFIRVRADKLDRLIDLIGELVIASSGAQLIARQESSPRFTEAALRIHDLVQEARDGALGLRMVPIAETFSRFQRVVRDVSKQMGKGVELQITGGDTELDKSMVETIADPLMHLVRNSLDHGIEPREERLAAGKSPQGSLALHAYHESGSIVIEVSDDGRGLRREAILDKAVGRGLVGPDVELSDEEIWQLIFLPGFSTAQQVTSLSGRGVGMDVVKRNVESLRGQINVASQPGRGTTMQVRLPLTLAIIDGFLTSVGPVSYVLPLETVAECLEVPPECTVDPDRVTGYFDLRGAVLPYLDVGRFYRHPVHPGARRSLLLVRDGASRIGLIVDRLHGEHQTVIKPLGPVFRDIRGLAGSTILGSGEVALILDVPGLIALVQSCRLQQPATAPQRSG